MSTAIPMKSIWLIGVGIGIWFTGIWTGSGNSQHPRISLITLSVALILVPILLLGLLILLVFVLTLMLRMLGPLLLVTGSALVLVTRLVLAQDWRAMHGRRLPGTLARLSASSLIGLAVLLAGRRRLALGDEWRAHLAGESGHDPVTLGKVRQALGFVASAIHLRLADAAESAWRPADAVLGSRTLSNLFLWGPVAVVLVAIVHHDGRFGLVADIQDPAALGAFLYGVIRTGRWWRGVKPPEPKARRARSDGGNG